MSEDELPIPNDNKGERAEVVFADLQSGSYFGELALSSNNKHR